ncbi:uncharacterized protein LOC125055737 [Pieris napi]|uniref:uncharacterized protein LOC125055737 n=1 Tax=Pieris napi TaxID=78633 RepID=UPI001FB99C24|nr:uncharacterized protein LOC125055737 [Pieris napi]
MYFFLLIVCLFGFGKVQSNANVEEQCIDYFKSGDDFDLNQLEGDWYAVYYWPPLQRQRRNCEIVQFKKTTQVQNSPGCSTVPFNQTLIESSYKNTAGTRVNLLYYGEDEVKYQIRSCNRLSKYIFIDVDDGYILGINCSTGGRGVLLAKTLPAMDEVQSIVEDIDIMTGRTGSPDCELSV